jgi:LMBR1-like membrane protein
MYAEIANVFNFEHNIIYDVFVVPEYDIDSPNYFYLSNLICLIPLIYLVYATNYGLFQLKISNIYALHKNHMTDPPCLLFSGMLLMRMAVPIAYNFLQLTKVKKAAIYEVMGPV